MVELQNHGGLVVLRWEGNGGDGRFRGGLTGFDQVKYLTRLILLWDGMGLRCGLGNFWAQSGLKSLDWFW